jgi:hypothetical protein
MKCPSCGNYNRDNKFCTKCGARLSSTAKSFGSNKRSKSNTSLGSPRILVTFAVTVIGLVALFIVLQMGRSSDSTKLESSVVDSTPDNNVNEIPLITPSISASSEVSPTPEKKISPTPGREVNLDNKKIVGSVVYDYDANIESGYVNFTLFSDDIETKDDRFGYIAFQDGAGFSGTSINLFSGSSIDRYNQLRVLIPSLVSVEVDSGKGFSKWENQIIKCYDFGCNLILPGFEDMIFKNYDSKKVIRIKYNISSEEQLKDAGMYITNASIDKITFEPATCSDIYVKVTQPAKGFEYLSASIEEDWKNNVYNSLISSGDC